MTDAEKAPRHGQQPSSASVKGSVLKSTGMELVPKKKKGEAEVQEVKNLEADDTLFSMSFVREFTPRSEEALKQLGVLPHELVLRTYESFQRKGTSPEIQKLRYQDYEQLRQETIHLARNQRKELIAAGWEPPKNLLSAPNLLTRSMPNLTNNLSRRSSTSSLHSNPANKAQWEREQARMEKVMKRQNKELEAMMAYEVKMASLLEKQEHKMESRKQREAQAREMRKQEAYKMAEKRRLWELAKAEEEEKEQRKREEMQRKLYEEELKAHQEAQLREEERRKESRLKELERKQRKDALEKRTQDILEQQYQLMEQKTREMDMREQQRKKLNEEKQKAVAEAHAEKTRAAQTRVQAVLEGKDRLLEEKRKQLNDKLDAQQRKMETFEKLKKEKIVEKLHQIKEKEDRRLQIIEEGKQKAQQRVAVIVEKKNHHEQHKDELDQQRQAEMQVRAELHQLNRRRKEQNVERLKRQEDYRRHLLVCKVSEDEYRTRELEGQKAAIMLERQRNQIEASRQKQALIKTFEQLKVGRNWNTLQKMTLADKPQSADDSTKSDLTPVGLLKNSMRKSHSATSFHPRRDAHSATPKRITAA